MHLCAWHVCQSSSVVFVQAEADTTNSIVSSVRELPATKPLPVPKVPAFSSGDLAVLCMHSL